MSRDDATDIPGDDRVTSQEMSNGARTDIPGDALTDQEIEQTNEQPTLLPPDGDGESSEIGLAFDAWNAMASEAGLPTVRKLAKPIRASLKARLSEFGGIDAWHAAIEQVRTSEFLCGGGQSGWRCSLQWLVKPSNFEKVTGGNFENRPSRGSVCFTSKSQATRDAVDRLIEEADRDA
jgi:hypothetical protein